jgi:hypothetical protein
MFLVNGEIKLDTFEIHQSCGSWFNTNVKVEKKLSTICKITQKKDIFIMYFDT